MSSPSTGGLILVCDTLALTILSSVMAIGELLSIKGISCVEKLELRRKRFSKSSCIYFISPSKESIAYLHKDFTAGYSLYGAAHVLLTSKLSEPLLDEIASNNELVSRLRTLKELHISFQIFNENTFLLPTSNLPSESQIYFDTLAE